MACRGFYRSLCISFSLAISASPALAADTIAKLGASGPSTGLNQQFGPSDINNRGEIVGTILQRDGSIRAYRYQNGKRSLLSTPANYNSEATGINNLGMISGSLSEAASGRSYPSGWDSRNRPLSLSLPSDYEGRATKVNDLQLFVGEMSRVGSNCFLNPTECDTRAFQFGTGTYLPLPSSIETVSDLTDYGLMVGSTLRGGRERAMSLLPGDRPFELPGLSRATYSTAVAVNALGQITGNVSINNGPLEPFFWDNGLATRFQAPTSGYTVARDMNQAAYVVGEYELVPGGELRAFIWTQARGFEDLNTFLPEYSPWVLYTARAINSRGEIVGRGTKYGEQSDYVLRLVHAKLVPTAETKRKLANKRGVTKRTAMYFTASLKDSAELPIEAGTLRLERSYDGGKSWKRIDTLETDEDGTVEISLRPTRSASYRVVGPLEHELLPPFDAAPIAIKVR